jgi:hypothetical protein
VKLSEAIKRGAARLPQTHGCFIEYNPMTQEPIGACALGAAYLELTQQEPPTHFFDNTFQMESVQAELEIADTIEELTGIDFLQMVKPPATTGPRQDFTLFTTIIDLNDTYRWTREQIADWLNKEGM